MQLPSPNGGVPTLLNIGLHSRPSLWPTVFIRTYVWCVLLLRTATPVWCLRSVLYTLSSVFLQTFLEQVKEARIRFLSDICMGWCSRWRYIAPSAGDGTNPVFGATNNLSKTLDVNSLITVDTKSLMTSNMTHSATSKPQPAMSSTSLPAPISFRAPSRRPKVSALDETQSAALTMRRRLRTHVEASGNQACDQCRRRRTKCTRTRPTCETCVENGHTCTYSDVLMKRGPASRKERQILVQAGLPGDVSYSAVKQRSPASQRTYDDRARVHALTARRIEATSASSPSTATSEQNWSHARSASQPTLVPFQRQIALPAFGSTHQEAHQPTLPRMATGLPPPSSYFHWNTQQSHHHNTQTHHFPSPPPLRVQSRASWNSQPSQFSPTSDGASSFAQLGFGQSQEDTAAPTSFTWWPGPVQELVSPSTATATASLFRSRSFDDGLLLSSADPVLESCSPSESDLSAYSHELDAATGVAYGSCSESVSPSIGSSAYYGSPVTNTNLLFPSGNNSSSISLPNFNANTAFMLPNATLHPNNTYSLAHSHPSYIL